MIQRDFVYNIRTMRGNYFVCTLLALINVTLTGAQKSFRIVILVAVRIMNSNGVSVRFDRLMVWGTSPHQMERCFVS